MKYIYQFLIIIVFSFVGEFLHWLIPLPVPAGIYGIILLFLALEFKLIPVHAIKDVSLFLIEIMPIMFVPAALGVLDIWNLIASNWLAYVILIIGTTILVMGVSGLVTQSVIRLEKRKKHE